MQTRLTPPLFLLLFVFISACVPIREQSASNSPSPATVAPSVSIFPTSPPTNTNAGISAVSDSSIRFLPAHIDLTNPVRVDIPLDGRPVWIAGIPFEGGSAWAVLLEDGRLQAFSVDKSGYTQAAISPDSLPVISPLTIYTQDGKLFALTAPGEDASPLMMPIFTGSDTSQIAYIATNGDLVLWQNGQGHRLAVNALPDSRVLTNGDGRLLLLSGPTDRYAHGVLGDELESTEITLVETAPEPHILRTIPIPEPDVIEGIYPIWADLNHDGEREIIVTLSNAKDGARIVVYDENGNLLANGPLIGTGFRWRHQLVVAPFGKSGENLLAVVRTPHIGGVLEFYRLNGNQLEITTEIPNISTHSIGSRNLFTAQAGDFDNDGQVELLAPDQSHTSLRLVSLENESIQLNLDAELITNLAITNNGDSDNAALAAGLSNNTLRLWLP